MHRGGCVPQRPPAGSAPALMVSDGLYGNQNKSLMVSSGLIYRVRTIN